jgi:WhiB family redox-sensing transcriptional regulator
MTTQRAQTMTRPVNRLELEPKVDWHEAAACDGGDLDQWFAEGAQAARFDRARAICEECPVKAACLRDALAEEDGLPAQLRFGLRGGKTREQRAILGGQVNDKTVCGKDVGTANGVARHRASGSKMLCPACHWHAKEHGTPDAFEHGTRAGYNTHRRRGEDACPACMQARKHYDRSRLADPEVRAARLSYEKARRAAIKEAS